ncbi:short-chain dehydrogenase [Pseudoxanthomonas kalamensis DSM 18571]|uniref:SDR family NAD(P)-dependent oxidoreductase n=1 Tax=Pseudoxanthomonas kalamensis TaxID=289483 RepID=UPI0013918A1E|nr:SDR family oxidoreductase [Pseudoxanthomonas kalamensis]KAF1711468.1 short-chain dehydrogenase [Pseudoxanthomonas kalamensis DSM 18571]
MSSAGARVAVVVGATGEFGNAIVRRLACEGLRIVAVARSIEALDILRDEIPGLVPCVADIGSDEAIEAIRLAVDEEVKVVVHGPGLSQPGGVAQIAPGALGEATNIKAGGLLRVLRALDDRLVCGARLIAIGGHYGFEPTDYACAPGIANAALTNLVRQLALAYGRRGITAHLVVPGPADTPRLRRIVERRALQKGVEAQAVLSEMRDEAALGEFTTPEQVAWAVSVLLAPEASSSTGSAFMVDAGRRRGS